MPEALETPPAGSDISSGGIAGMMEQLDRAVAMDSGKPAAPAAPAPPEPPAPAKPAELAAPAAPAKPAAKADPAPAADPTPKPNEEPDWSKAPQKWHKIYEDHKAKTTGTIRSLEEKVKALESKRVEAPGDAAKIAAYEKQIEDIRKEAISAKQRLAEVDFTKSDEYKTNFVDRAQRIWTKAVQLVTQLKVTDAEGNQRPATQADFDAIRTAPEHLRAYKAKELFGDDIDPHAITKYADAIDQVREEADLAVAKHAANHEQTATQRAAEARKGQESYQAQYQSALKAIQDNPEYGQWFRPDENNPEESKLLQDGFDEIEKVTTALAEMPADAQAAYAAVFRARAAAMPRLLVAHNRVKAELEAVKAELTKLRGKDPGNIGKGGGETPSAEGPQGIAAMAALFDKSD